MNLIFVFIKILQVILASALVAAAVAFPQAPRYGAPATYVEENLAPQPFAYEYGVNDDYSKANFQKSENQDTYGNVAGSFTIALPDGRIQTTRYTATNEDGFIADVSYEGTPVYPAEKAAPAYAPPRAYAPAPVPAYAPAPAYQA